MLYSILVPILNEEKTLEKVILELHRIFNQSQQNFEILLLLDQANSDDSCEIAQRLARDLKEIRFFLIEKKGKGALIREGIQRSIGDYIFIQDADQEYQPSDYADILPHIDERTLFLGERRVSGGQTTIFRLSSLRPTPLSFFKDLGYRGLNSFFNFLFNTRYKDIACMYKGFPRSVIRDGRFHESGFAFEVELLVHLAKKNLNLIQVPVSYNPRLEGKKLKPWREGIKFLIVMLKIRLAYLRSASLTDQIKPS